MFKKILIANRGEIACRVIRTAHRLGIHCVAVYSEADAHAMHVTMADEAYCLGPAPAKDSYLKGDLILEAAKKSGAEAVHPGYGFLSENSEFSQACEKAGITFVGPPASAMESMGSKSAAKSIMEKAEVPLVPGYHGDDQTPSVIFEAANKIGYPVLLKATAGGGGKGMRVVEKAENFDEALAAAQREAQSSFGDSKMLVEKYLSDTRHVEIQVFCDQQGSGVYLFERDCSVQRRHQKVLEEAPAPGMSEELRQEMGEAAVRAAQAIGYVGAGTVEFLLNHDGSFYFMEMNTRLQVEHPVTEMITEQDLVEWQLRVAANEPLPLEQEKLTIQGHSFEVRIYAEDPDHDFLPATGNLDYLSTPKESIYVRVDTGVREGDTVSVYYDPMIAKLIVWDQSRKQALQRLERALKEYHITGLKTNIRFLQSVISTEAYQEGKFNTAFIETYKDELFQKPDIDLNKMSALASMYLLLGQKKEAALISNHSPNSRNSDPYSPWLAVNAWRANEPSIHRFSFSYEEGESFAVLVEEKGKEHYQVEVGGESWEAFGGIEGNQLVVTLNGCRTKVSIVENHDILTLFTDEGTFELNRIHPDLGINDDEGEEGSLTAPMNGSIVAILTEAGRQVEEGDALVVMEAMKMEHTIKAPRSGKVQEIFFATGDLVDDGAELISLEPIEE